MLLELDADLLAWLREPAVARAAAAVGLPVPEGDPLPRIEELAAQFHSELLAPAGGAPLVQSLIEEGRYEGQAALAVRDLARAAGVELDGALARGAPPDHLGALLLLWALLAPRWPEAALRLRRDHLSWALSPLARLALRPGFYGRVAAATGSLIELLPAEPPA